MAKSEFHSLATALESLVANGQVEIIIRPASPSRRLAALRATLARDIEGWLAAHVAPADGQTLSTSTITEAIQRDLPKAGYQLIHRAVYGWMTLQGYESTRTITSPTGTKTRGYVGASLYLPKAAKRKSKGRAKR